MKLYPKIDLHIDGYYWGTTERYSTLLKALQALKSQAPVYTKGKLSQFLTASFKDSAGRRRIKIYENRKKKTRKKRMVRRKRRVVRRNPSFERTLRSSASMTPAVFSATMRGNLSSELMVRSWNQEKLVRGVIFKYKIDPNHYYFIFKEPGVYRSESYTIAEATTGLTLGGTGSFKQIIEDGEEKIRKFIASKGKRKYDSLIASAEKLNHIGR